MRPAILIHGPTASGKTALSLALADRLDGEVVNADSMQTYTDLQVISARPSAEEMGSVPHHLFGHVPARERYSTGQWLRDARRKIESIWKRGKTPIVTGGTGLYHLALIAGLSEIPPVPEDIRDSVSESLKQDGLEAVYKRLADLDPLSAESLNPADRQRITRALEVYLATGQSIRSFQRQRKAPLLGDGEWMGVALTPPRARLYSRIDKRFEGMLMEGAMQEVKGLLEQDLPDDLPAMKAHGVPWLLAYLRGELSAEAAAQHAKRDTRRYAKRQFTWIGRQFPFWPRIPSLELADRKRVILALYKELDRA